MIILLAPLPVFCYSMGLSEGVWRNWLAHRTVDPVVAGSSPVAPANSFFGQVIMVADLISRSDKYKTLHPLFGAAFEFLKRPDLAEIAPGRYALQGDALFAIVQDYETKPVERGVLEAHRRYIDIQYIVSGSESVGYAPFETQPETVAFSKEKDIGFYEGSFALCPLQAGSLMILWPEDAHAPGLSSGASAKVRKVVIKIEVA